MASNVASVLKCPFRTCMHTCTYDVFCLYDKNMMAILYQDTYYNHKVCFISSYVCDLANEGIEGRPYLLEITTGNVVYT